MKPQSRSPNASTSPLYIAAFVWLLFIPIGHATIVVSPGGCSLNDAVLAANTNSPVGDCEAGGTGNDLISINRAAGLDDITLTGELLITSEMRIESNNSQSVIVRGANGGSRVFHVDGGDLRLENIQIFNGIVSGSGDPTDKGGGLRVVDGSATLFNCAFYNNFVDEGSGDAIYGEDAQIAVTDCTFALNGPPSTSSDGHIIDLVNSELALTRIETRGPNTSGTNSNLGNRNKLLTAVNSFIEVDQSGLFTTRNFDGFEIEIFDGSEMLVENSTVGAFPPEDGDVTEPVFFTFFGLGLPQVRYSFLNSTLDASVDRFRTAANLPGRIYQFELTNSIWNGASGQGNSIPELNSVIGPLQDNGGPIETMALFWYSSAINGGIDAQCPEFDQRGRSRVRCDRGAYEFIADADIAVNITPVTPGPYVVGQSVALDVNLTNLGPDNANLVAIDFSTQNFVIESVDGACVSTSCIIIGLEADNAALPFQTVRVTGTPTASGQNDFSLTATAEPSTGAVYQETNNSNNSDTLTTALVPNADLQLVKTLSTPPPYALGDPIQYQITIINNGPDFADNVVFTDSPEGLNVTGISGCSNPPAGPCNLSGLNNGNSINLTVNAEILQPRFDNQGAVSSDTFDADLSNNVDARNNGADVSADADIKMTLSRETNPPFFTGQTVQYTVRLTNLGPDTATDVTVDLATVNFFPTAALGPCDPTGSLPCNIGNLSVDAVQDVIIEGFGVAPGFSGFTATAYSDQQDAEPDNNVDNIGVSIIESADVSVDLEISQPSSTYARDQVITYIGRISNAGDDYADNIALDITTENLDILSVGIAGCSEAPCIIPVLARPASETLVIQAKIIALGPFDLAASVDADQFDPFPANNTDDEGNGGTATVILVDEVFRDAFEQ